MLKQIGKSLLYATVVMIVSFLVAAVILPVLAAAEALYLSFKVTKQSTGQTGG
jgi:hypothetical protein